ncbi:glycosyltransferase [Paenibacillus sp. F411]|uniref:Spore protein YkvP/CgeB glycosyl transferase-like domain-containing protein n=1 Tax=Paenibacillus algicola TaxID=2565926 RepID=A0A4P8XHB7_9BACL|nr:MULTISPECIES: glycosyltransferase [Paenibacillus]MBO2943994.1 glycosyltransferase [Paenibacillus sp. F411]QCT01906.1 hypothetical protein E6C60_1188 [Paenibacillus algicola]
MKQRLKQADRRKQHYREGFLEGYRLGLCRAVTDRIPDPASPQLDLKLMYIPQGFESIDAGIEAALSTMVREWIQVSPEGMLEAARKERPDVILVMNGLHVFPKDWTMQLEEVSSLGITTAVWFVDDPYFTEETSVLCRHYDLVFTHELSCAELYRSLGAERVHYMPLAVHPGIFAPIPAGADYQSDICFIGNAFRNRAALFDELAPYLSGKKVRIIGGFWERLTRYKQLSPCIKSGFIPPAETAKYYNGAKIVINLHRPAGIGDDNRNSLGLPGRSINPRTFEISACGTLQLTDIREDLYHYYEPGVDIETFRDARELQHKLEHYLSREQERLDIAVRGLRTTWSRHTYKHRLPQLLEILAQAVQP